MTTHAPGSARSPWKYSSSRIRFSNSSLSIRPLLLPPVAHLEPLRILALALAPTAILIHNPYRIQRVEALRITRRRQPLARREDRHIRHTRPPLAPRVARQAALHR